MALSKRLETYSDIERWFNAALMNPHGGTVVLPNHAAAVRWRSRAYYFRTLYREQQEPILAASHRVEDRVRAGTTPWDDFTLTIEDNKIHIRVAKDDVLEFIPADGIMPVEPTATELLDQATGPAAKVGSPSLVEVHGFTEEDVARTRAEFLEILKRGE